ncbi:MAG: hypothetical protein QOK42_65 [Frankiaceae bacterium]|jgi:hypothetical protein|nr:hypothetical protein [Frankiaceae bacterium]
MRRSVDGMDLEDLRLAVYGSFAETGTAPSPAALAERLKVEHAQVEAGLADLARARHVVLDPAGRILMAHPFAAVPLGFSVMGRHTLWWGGCAWDAFALPHLLPDEPDVLVATRCPACNKALAWVVDREAPPHGDQVAHFLVPVSRMWDDVVHACSNQRLFCDEGCVAFWLDFSGNQRGYVLDLDTLWRLASRWYEGRLERGYVRRDPSNAADYLRGVGLRGEFWGL